MNQQRHDVDTDGAQSTPAASPRSETDWQSVFGGHSPHPDVMEMLETLDILEHRAGETLTAEHVRGQPRLRDAARIVLRERGQNLDVEEVGSVQDEEIDGPGGPLQLRIYTPIGAAPADRALPVVVYFHGGAWTSGDLDTHDDSARALCNVAGTIVVSCNYRLAPEHRFPSAHQDAYAAYRHVVQHARDFGGDHSRIAVAGEDAGANLAAVCCLNARLEGLREPLHQVLIAPIADSRFDTPSHVEMARARPFGSPAVRWAFQQYLEKPSQGETPAISLVRAASLQGVPPATIVCAELDPLRSDGELLAERLRASGVPVAQRSYAGVPHDFLGLGRVLMPARDAQQFVGDRLREAFFAA